MNSRLERELASFSGLWKGGYFEGDPLDPMGRSSYGQIGYISVLHATYLRCIKPYVHKDTVALEIGPGRGAWTRTMLHAKRIYALDAIAERNNCFFEFLGYPENVEYFHVNDFKCDMIQDSAIDFVFSYGCLCHVSFDGIREYARNLYAKCREGANAFWMIADYDKYDRSVSSLDRLSVWQLYMPNEKKYFLLKMVLKYFYHLERKKNAVKLALRRRDEDDEPRPGRWFNARLDRTCEMLERTGYKVLSEDVGTCLRDPIIHFRKP